MVTGMLGLGVGLGLANTAQAETGRSLIGVGRIFDNDFLGDGHDRWRSGSYTLSAITGPDWDGQLPASFGQLIEYRLSAEIITPGNLTTPPTTDRRYAGILTFGMHTHWSMGRTEASAGIDLNATGPQTGIGHFQSSAHRAVGDTPPSTRVLDDQIGNAIYPTFVGEVGRSYDLGNAMSFRPFVGAEAGLETLVRVGGDLTIGQFGRGDMLVRDAVTGQRYRAVRMNRTPGLSLVVGADVAHVASSHLLPSDGPAPLDPTRTRVRLGLHWQGERMAAFYGLTYLSREFKTQPEHQLVGSLHISLKF